VKTLLLTFILPITFLLATTADEIRKSQKQLQQTTAAQQKASKQLETIVANIKNGEKEIAALEANIDKLTSEYAQMEKQQVALEKEVEQAQQLIQKTAIELEEKQSRFISLFSEQFSMGLALEQTGEPTFASVVSKEVYEQYKIYNTKMLNQLSDDILELEKTQKQKDIDLANAKKTLENIAQKKELLIAQKKKKEQWIAKLNQDEARYQRELKEVANKQNELRSTLAKLNIIQAKEAQEAKRRAKAQQEAIKEEALRKKRLRAQQAAAKKQEQATGKKVDLSTLEASIPSQRVRQINSSYQPHSVYNYRGPKTISPIKGAKVVKRFGTQEDPIYRIKVFNESITLQAPNRDANVASVLNGKVVFAGDSSMLGKVVVVAHDGNMHTVYAGLSKIAPTIQAGARIRQGYVVGKVKSRLIFEATKDSKYIDPLKLLRV